jgi:hypothetical protein
MIQELGNFLQGLQKEYKTDKKEIRVCFMTAFGSIIGTFKDYDNKPDLVTVSNCIISGTPTKIELSIPSKSIQIWGRE